jgi:ankyrin repeat protein
MNDEESIRLLLKHGADVNKNGGMWHSALQAALSENCRGYTNVVDLLMESGADVNARGGLFGTALEAAYRNGFYLIIAALYRNGASHALLGGKWGSALGSALSGACHTLLHQFVEIHGVDVNQPCGKWGRPLHFCITVRGSDDIEELVTLFLEAGADPNGIGGRYGTPLGAAVAFNQFQLAEQLIDKGAISTVTAEKKKRSALHIACIKKSLMAVHFLIERGADINKYSASDAILQTACQVGDAAIISKLISHGADIHAVHQGRYGTALHAATISGSTTAVEFLLSQSADATLSDGCFGSVLQAAAFKSPIYVVKLLLDHKADPNHVGGRYKTALQAASAAGRENVVRLLLRYGADVSITGGKCGSALHAACAAGRTMIVRLLLARGADPNLVSGRYGSVLSAAALNRRIEVLRVLLHEAKVDPRTLGQHKAHFSRKRWPLAAELVDLARNTPDQLQVPDPESLKLVEDPAEITSPVLANGNQTLMTPDTSVSASETATEEIAPLEKEPVSVVIEDMSPLSWLQVECGYGGDLNGPGR